MFLALSTNRERYAAGSCRFLPPGRCCVLPAGSKQAALPHPIIEGIS